MTWFTMLTMPVQFGIIALTCFALLGFYAIVVYIVRRGFTFKKNDVEIVVEKEEEKVLTQEHK